MSAPRERTATAPRVLLVGNFLSRHVSTRSVCEELADRLKAAGWNVLRTSDRRGRAARLIGMQRSIWRCRHRFDVAQVDVFSGAAFFWAEAACWSLSRLGKPFVLTLHGGLLPEFGRRWPRRLRRLLASAAAVTTPSAYLQQALAPFREDLLLLRNPLDLTAYRFRQRRPLAPRLVWLRAFHETYNPRLAVEVLARLRPEVPEVRLTMVGPDKGDGSLQGTRRLARRLGVEDRLALPGAVAKSAVPAVLDRGEIFLNTSNADNAPVSVLEAMACGLPVVSTEVGGLRHLLEPEAEGLLVPAGDAEAMTGAVLRLLRHPEEAERLALAARRRSEASDWPGVLAHWQRLLRDAAAGRGVP